MNTKEDLQKKYLELHELEQQIKAFQQQATMLHQQFVEIILLIEHVDSLEKTKMNAPAYAAIGAGIFVASEVKNTDHLLVNVGAGVLVKKRPKEAKETLLRQAEDLKAMRHQIEQELQRLTLQGQHTQREMQSLIDAKI